MKSKGLILLLLFLSIPIIIYRSGKGSESQGGDRALLGGTYALESPDYFFNNGAYSSFGSSGSNQDFGFGQRSWKIDALQNIGFSWNPLNEYQYASLALFDVTPGLTDYVEVDIAGITSVEDLAGALGKALVPDSVTFLKFLTSADYLSAYDLDPCSFKAYLIPHKVVLPSTAGPFTFIQKVISDFEGYWDEDKRIRAQSLGLSPAEVVILASIVDAETWECEEMPQIAGLYLNRLKHGMRLQADPTVIYACRQQQPDSVITRVLGKHLAIKSPYNTYLHKGLPPGPIGMPDIMSIDAVLDAASHDYLYMVANPDSFGYHSFSNNLEQHRIYRERYIAWLEEREAAQTDSLIIPELTGLSDNITEYDSLLVSN